MIDRAKYGRKKGTTRRLSDLRFGILVLKHLNVQIMKEEEKCVFDRSSTLKQTKPFYSYVRDWNLSSGPIKTQDWTRMLFLGRVVISVMQNWTLRHFIIL